MLCQEKPGLKDSWAKLHPEPEFNMKGILPNYDIFRILS